MCIAVPGRILSIQERTQGQHKAKVECGGNIIEVVIDMVDVQQGDYVLIHAGCAIEVIDEKEADEIEELLKELEGAFNE